MSDQEFGRSKPGRPPNTEALRNMKCCEKCRELKIAKTGRVRCAKGKELGTAETCKDYDDAARDRPYFYGGIMGKVTPR